MNDEDHGCDLWAVAPHPWGDWRCDLVMNSWRCTARFTNRSYDSVALQCATDEKLQAIDY
jgi:hypothetical protein